MLLILQTLKGTIVAKYSDIRGVLKTGDIVLFSGTSRISRVIQHFTKSIYSHVGIVYSHADLGNLLFETTTLSNIPDIDAGAPVRGVQLVPLSARIASYRGGVAVRQLVEPLTTIQAQAVARARREFAGRPYEQNKLDLVFAALDWIDLDTAENADLDSLFCSELVAEIYKRCKLLPPKLPTDEYTPADFARGFGSILGPVVEVER